MVMLWEMRGNVKFGEGEAMVGAGAHRAGLVRFVHFGPRAQLTPRAEQGMVGGCNTRHVFLCVYSLGDDVSACHNLRVMRVSGAWRHDVRKSVRRYGLWLISGCMRLKKAAPR